MFVLWGCSGPIISDTSEPIPKKVVMTTEKELIPESEPIPEPAVVIPEPTPKCLVFDDFTGNQTVGWQRVNDSVMGGRSLGNLDFQDQTMILSGSVNLNGGGFTSVRAPLPTGSLSPFDSVVITAKTDGRGYQLTFRDNNFGRLSHRLGLDLSSSPEWQTVTIKLADLEPAFFGQAVQAKGFDKNQAGEIGIILNDGQGGDYRLEVKEIKFCAVAPSK